MTEQLEQQIAALRLCARDYVAQCIAEGLDPYLVGLSMVMAGTDVIATVAGPGAAYQVAEGARDRVDRSMVAPDGKPH